MSRVNNKEKYKEYDHNYYIKHKRPKSKIGQAELKIADLEAKLAEMTKKYELASCPTGGLVDRVGNLEQQLAEKDKEIERLKNLFKLNNEVVINQGKEIFDLRVQVLQQKQNQTQLAIQELEKVKDNLKDRISMMKNEEHSYLQKVVAWYDICEQINKQIKALKGE